MNLNKLINLSCFAFTALLAASIPVSRTFISVFQFALAGIFILEGVRFADYVAFYRNHKPPSLILRFIPFHVRVIVSAVVLQIRRVSQNRLFQVFMLFSAVYLLGMVHTSNFAEALRVLRNMLPILLLPLFFAAMPAMSSHQKNIILLFFALSTTISSLISLGIFISGAYDDIRRISPFINHIHLSIFVNYSIFIIFYFLNRVVVSAKQKIIAIIWIGWLIVFQVFILKSMTGVVVLMLGAYFILFFPGHFLVRIKKKFKWAMLLLIPVSILGYTAFSAIRFFDVDEINPDELEHFTERGNPYHHDLNNRMIENGHYVFIYISETELREQWNQLSDYDFDSLDNRGNLLQYTLIRYLTSKGLRKDAAGVQQLSSHDIEMIENGFANHIFSKKMSLYPRIYQIFWELDVYFKSGNPTGHSVTQRLESLKMGTKIVASYPYFGVGTGDLLDQYHHQYNITRSPVPEHRRITGANQFLNFVVRFGFIGLIIILFSWLYPAIKRKAFHNPLFTMFFIISVVAMFSEEILRFQTGVSFFAFFYSFFIFLDDAGGGEPVKNT